MPTTLRPFSLSLALLCGLWGQVACADWRSEVPGAAQVGQGQFTWFGFVVYEAHLWSATAAPDWTHAFALELVYRRELSRDTLVQASLDEMRRLGIEDDTLLGRWAGEMRQSFVDVQPGQRIGYWLLETSPEARCSRTMSAIASRKPGRSFSAGARR